MSRANAESAGTMSESTGSAPPHPRVTMDYSPHGSPSNDVEQRQDLTDEVEEHPVSQLRASRPHQEGALAKRPPRHHICCPPTRSASVEAGPGQGPGSVRGGGRAGGDGHGGGERRPHPNLGWRNGRPVSAAKQPTKPQEAPGDSGGVAAGHGGVAARRTVATADLPVDGSIGTREAGSGHRG
jgi:hypothetical protein